MTQLRNVLLILVFIGLAQSAQAGLITIVADPGVAGVIGPGNDVLADIYGEGVLSRGGYRGASISVAGPVVLTFAYLGSEAAYLNKLVVGGTVRFVNNGPTPTAIDDMFSYAMGGAGLIPFSFMVDGGADEVVNCPTPGTDCNRKNSPPRFFTSFDEAADAMTGNSLVVFLDDGGGNNDEDFDDLVFRVSAEPEAVPEPGSMLLVGSGLAALLARRRARRNGGMSRPHAG